MKKKVVCLLSSKVKKTDSSKSLVAVVLNVLNACASCGWLRVRVCVRAE